MEQLEMLMAEAVLLILQQEQAPEEAPRTLQRRQRWLKGPLGPPSGGRQLDGPLGTPSGGRWLKLPLGPLSGDKRLKQFS